MGSQSNTSQTICVTLLGASYMRLRNGIMISDDAIVFFEGRGYFLPPSGIPVIKCVQREGEVERWVITLYSRERRHHISEYAGSAVEAVARMVTRLSRSNDLVPIRETGRLEALEVAFNQVLNAADKWVEQFNVS